MRRFISADNMRYLGADGTITGYNLFAYCANNPIMHQDSNGNTMMQAGNMLSTLFAEIGRAIEAMTPAYGVCVALLILDGPVPILDIVAVGGAVIITGVAAGYAISNVLQSKPAADEVAEKKAKDLADQIKQRNGAPLNGYKGGRKYKNEPQNESDQKLPDNVNYREYDVNPYVKGQNRGKERIVIGDDGSVWYTDDHYHSFKQIE